MSKPLVTLTYGLPASGKTTAAMELIANSARRVRRLNLDDLRAAIDPGQEFNRAVEESTQALLVTMADQLVAEGTWDLVIDNTHVHPRMLKKLRHVLAGRVRWDVIDLSDVSIEECAFRDWERGGREGGRSVGKDVIERLHRELVRNKKDGYLSVEWLEDVPVPSPVAPWNREQRKRTAIIVDIDGTLARMVDRGPYDTSRYAEDALHEDVAEIVRRLQAPGAAVIVMSGRDESFRDVTEGWLRAHGVWFDGLVMRPAGDIRRDSVIKAELFDKYVRPFYQVLCALDDRDQVIRECWRAMGVRALQVADGRF